MIRLINKIECCPAKHLATAVLISNSKISFPHYVPWEKIPTYGLLTAETSDALESVRMFTTKVTCRIRCRRPEWTEPMAFRLTTVGGVQLVVGLSFRPFPTWTTKDVYSENPSDRSEVQLNLSWKSIYGMMEVVG